MVIDGDIAIGFCFCGFRMLELEEIENFVGIYFRSHEIIQD